MNTPRLVLHHLIWLMLLPAIGLADSAPMVVGENGTVLKLHSGSYGALFPGSTDAPAENGVLALDVMTTSGSERLMVPGTSDLDLEAISALYFCKESGLTYVLWEGLVNGVHPFLNLASFDGSQWSEIIPIAGNVFADKGAANLVIVPESEHNPKAESAEASLERTTIYVAWHENTPRGGEDFLVPIILENGEYLGGERLFKLSDFLAPDPAKSQLEPSIRSIEDPNLQGVLAIQPSAKETAVIVGFINRETGRFVTLEFEMLPLALSALVEHVKDLVVRHAATSHTLQELIASLQSDFLSQDSVLHPSVLEYLAVQIEELLAGLPSVEAAAAPDVLEKVGAYMIHVGARVKSKGMVDLEPLDIFELDHASQGTIGNHHLKVSLVAERAAPSVDGPATIFLSRNGAQALAAWSDETTVFYRETQGETWGEIQQVELREELTRETVYRILAERTLSR